MALLKDGVYPYDHRGAVGWKYFYKGVPSYQFWRSRIDAVKGYVEIQRTGKYAELLKGKDFEQACRILNIKI